MKTKYKPRTIENDSLADFSLNNKRLASLSGLNPYSLNSQRQIKETGKGQSNRSSLKLRNGKNRKELSVETNSHESFSHSDTLQEIK